MATDNPIVREEGGEMEEGSHQVRFRAAVTRLVGGSAHRGGECASKNN